MVLVLRAVRQLPLARAVGADLPDVAGREVALLCLLAARVEYELVSAREPGGHRVRARARDEDLGAPHVGRAHRERGGEGRRQTEPEAPAAPHPGHASRSGGV